MSKKRGREQQEEEVKSMDVKRRCVSKSSSFNINRIPMDIMRRCFEFLMNPRKKYHKDLACVCRTNRLFYTVFINLVPPKKIHIAAYTGNDSKGDGTILNPLQSLKPLHEDDFWRARKELKRSGKYDCENMVQIMQCNRSECELMICNQEGCSKMVCREHNIGSGTYDDEMRRWRFDEPAVCSIKNCNVAFCWMHYKDGPMEYIDRIPLGRSTRLQRCNVCESASMVEASIGMYNVPDVMPLCNGHSKECRAVYIERLDDWYHPDDKYCSDFDSEEWDEENACGFTCCPTCSDEHRCGYTPTEYM
jgi:hypothetical protein